VKGLELPGRLSLTSGLTVDNLRDRTTLSRAFDGLREQIEGHAIADSIDHATGQALEMLSSSRVREAFDLKREPASVRDSYGRGSVGEKALLARRLVEAGTTFVLVSGAWGYFDHHGDTVKWGGIVKGLTPLLPTIDQALYALITDLEARGLLDDTLILMMGEFGRSPVVNKDHGRDHWTNVMSMLMAGGGLRHGQAIGSTDSRGGTITSRKVGPSDLAATVYRHLEIPTDSHWLNPQGRPVPIITEGGQPIPELF
jgi:uncharacterized protein (DUF1501 family)